MELVLLGDVMFVNTNSLINMCSCQDILPPIAQVKGYTTIYRNLLLYLSLQTHELNKPFFMLS